eukprot:5886568-Pyramimonas_sp.AAC.1
MEAEGRLAEHVAALEAAQRELQAMAAAGKEFARLRREVGPRLKSRSSRGKGTISKRRKFVGCGNRLGHGNLPGKPAFWSSAVGTGVLSE